MTAVPIAPPHPPHPGERPEVVRARIDPAFAKLDLGPPYSLRIDAEGRWVTARFGEHFLRRKLDGGLVVSDAAGALRDEPPTSAWHDAARDLARAALRWIDEAPVVGADPSRLRQRLERVEQWDRARWAEEPARFAAAYPEPIPILPPDRYRDLVVLPAMGCPWGRCAFCAWYKDATFEVLDEPAFERHLDAVADLLGAASPARNGLFLGSASALSVPDRALVRAIRRATERFGPFDRGVAAFLDPDHAPRRSADDYRALRELGLTRVVLGLETGHGPLRGRLGKLPDLGRLVETARRLKAGGVTVGASVLAGIGRPEEQADHAADTARVVAEMGLDRSDVVYVSPLAATSSLSSAGAGPAEGAASSSPAVDPVASGRALIETLRKAGGPLVSPYRLDMYRYYAW